VFFKVSSILCLNEAIVSQVATLVGMGFKLRFTLKSAFGQFYFTKIRGHTPA
jgi:hypothetical protein